jgi:hypothetical protein
MKSIKMLGLAVVAALALAALAGVGSASATSLCSAWEHPCAAGKQLSLPQTLNAHATKFTLTTSGLEPANCNSPELKLQASKKEASGIITGQVTALNVNTCSVGWCGKAEATHLPYNAEIKATGGGSGTVTLSSSGAGKPAIKLNGCKFGGNEANCVFGASKITSQLTGGNHASLAVSKTTLSLEEGYVGACVVENWELNANYEATAPNAGSFYTTIDGNEVVKGSTVLCKSKSVTCSESEILSLGQSLQASTTKAVLEASGLETTCESSLEGHTVEESLEGRLLSTISSLTLANCSGACKTAKAVNLPYTASLNAIGEGNGTLTVSGGGTGDPTFEFSGCTIFNQTCQYGASSLALDMKGGSSGEVLAVKEPLTKRSGGGFCPESGTISATYVFTTPKPVWVSKRS